MFLTYDSSQKIYSTLGFPFIQRPVRALCWPSDEEDDSFSGVFIRWLTEMFCKSFRATLGPQHDSMNFSRTCLLKNTNSTGHTKQTIAKERTPALINAAISVIKVKKKNLHSIAHAVGGICYP